MAEDNNTTTDNSDYEEICYLCRRPESKAGKMIHIPNNICICPDCMQKTFDSMGSMSGFPGMMSGMPPYMDMSKRKSMKSRRRRRRQRSRKKRRVSLISTTFRHHMSLRSIWMNMSSVRTMPKR